MKLSVKSRYAVIAMLEIAMREHDDLVTLSSIASSQSISPSYYESLFAKLRKVKLVVGVKGPGGGYRLGKPPSKISVVQIVLAVEELSDGSPPTTDYQCNEASMLWEDLSLKLHMFLDEITLADLIRDVKQSPRFLKQSTLSSKINLMFQPVKARD